MRDSQTHEIGLEGVYWHDDMLKDPKGLARIININNDIDKVVQKKKNQKASEELWFEIGLADDKEFEV